MKRLLLAVTGTIASVVALLSFKTETNPIASALPAAALGASNSSGVNPVPSNPVPSSAAGSSPAPSSPAPSSPAPSSAATAMKSYLGSAITTQYGVVQVKVTLSAGTIANVAFAQLTSFDRRSQQINSSAGPMLLQETLSAQSARVDTISGASYTSDGYRQSLQSALDQAGIK